MPRRIGGHVGVAWIAVVARLSSRVSSSFVGRNFYIFPIVFFSSYDDVYSKHFYDVIEFSISKPFVKTSVWHECHVLTCIFLSNGSGILLKYCITT